MALKKASQIEATSSCCSLRNWVLTLGYFTLVVGCWAVGVLTFVAGRGYTDDGLSGDWLMIRCGEVGCWCAWVYTVLDDGLSGDPLVISFGVSLLYLLTVFVVVMMPAIFLLMAIHKERPQLMIPYMILGLLEMLSCIIGIVYLSEWYVDKGYRIAYTTVLLLPVGLFIYRSLVFLFVVALFMKMTMGWRRTSISYVKMTGSP